MRDSLIFIARIIGLILGISFISTRLLYKTEQGLLQSKLQDLWITIDDLQKSALSRHTAFMRVMADTLSRGFDRVFGQKLISLQSLVVSICYAVASILLTLILVKMYVGSDIDSTFVSILIVYLFVGSFPAFIPLIVKDRAKQKKYLLIWLTASLTFTYANIGLPYYELAKLMYDVGGKQLFSLFILISFGMLSALILYSTFVMIARLSFRWLSRAQSITKIALISLLNITPIAVLYLVFKLMLLKLDYSDIDSSVSPENIEQVKSILSNWGAQLDIAIVLTGIFLFLMGIVFIIPAILFLLLSLAMVVHRIIWPLLHRPLYKLQELEITQRNNLLTVLGLALILVSLGLYDWIQAIVKLVL